MNVTLDGFMSGPNCELDWHFKSWTPDLAEALCLQLSNADTIILGRITYCAMAKYWTMKTLDPSFPKEDIAFAEMMNRYTKVVFTQTLTVPQWNNSILVKGNIEKEIKRLKKQAGKNLIIYGSGKLVSALINRNLVDEYQLWVHPVLLAKGKPLFQGLPDNLKTKLQLVETKAFSSGVVILNYRCVA